MISRIEINGAATFKGTHLLDGLKKFNYLFGANGSGKTTISRVISTPDAFSSCSVLWENQSPLETLVYNRGFINRNFNQQKLQGVFTLGETGKEILDKIELIKDYINKLQSEINTLNSTLQGVDGNGGKKADLSKLIQSYQAKFFTLKQKHSEKLSGTQSGEGMRGFIGSQDSFMKKVLDESIKNTATLHTLTEFENKAQTIFLNALSIVNLLPEISALEILQHENNPVLQKRVIGKDDVDISSLINKLNNSDWVRQGISYHDACDDICPFCQQPTSETFRQSLTEYFDESFMQDSNAIRTLVDNYTADAFCLQSQVQQLIDMQSEFFDIVKLTTEKQLLDSIITINKQRLIEKQKESSQAFTLETHANAITKIVELVTAANTKIADNNRIVYVIISTLIRELIQEVRENKNSIKQMFILTHNIYFHKEVSFNKRRSNGVLNEESFWRVKKNGKVSTIEKQAENPIRTSYELLWDEVRSDTRNNATLQNTLRRILENYFKILGGIPLDKLYKKFEGEDKVKCKALCSWVNDGSHSTFDEDFYTPLDTALIEKFLEIFKSIFEKTEHIAHYNMMIGMVSEGEEEVKSTSREGVIL